jgi:hypothetical protein
MMILPLRLTNAAFRSRAGFIAHHKFVFLAFQRRGGCVIMGAL